MDREAGVEKQRIVVESKDVRYKFTEVSVLS